MSVTVMGAGAFGTALAIALRARGPVTLWARDADHVADMQSRRENAQRLPGIPLPDQVTPVAKLPKDGAPILLAVPMQKLRSAVEKHGAELGDAPLVACCKGIEIATGLGPVGVIRDVIGDRPTALLTGPSFAADIAQGLPTALALACADANLGSDLQARLSTETLRLYRSADVAGAELGGALKNVIAIAAGAAIGAGYGDSARASVMTRGFAEMQRFATLRGAQPETLMGLSGFGDLVLTCTSDLSRNFQLGLTLGRGGDFDPRVTVEGAATAEAVTEDAARLGLDMPITKAVHALVQGQLTASEAMTALISRPLKEE
ncbi:MAG: NAD(P)-dependent glycerol-3-phosphate dehydrogenase [Rhodobacteraceae bacterium]|nr:NAD(P)-dependent glycerol-3-phosphate dehydrogenase [Paracoccaceae bacterium]